MQTIDGILTLGDMSDVESSINTNSTNISSNNTNIATNTSSISTNTTSINANTSTISTINDTTLANFSSGARVLDSSSSEM